MQVNDKIICPACKEASIAKLKNKMDGFTQVGRVLVCMLCGAELETYTPPENATGGKEKKLECCWVQCLRLRCGLPPLTMKSVSAKIANTS